MDSSPSPSRRPLLILRAALLATALLLGIAAYALRTGGDDEPAARQLNGRTSQGFPIWAIVEDGQVKAIFISWHSRICTPGARWGSVTVFKEPDHPFRRSGRSFTTSEQHTGRREGSWVPIVTTSASGELSADGRSASGSASGHMDWVVHGARAAWCDSGPVTWRVAAGG